MRSLICAGLMALVLVAVHYTPNHYCVAAFGIPCDITQGGN